MYVNVSFPILKFSSQSLSVNPAKQSSPTNQNYVLLSKPVSLLLNVIQQKSATEKQQTEHFPDTASVRTLRYVFSLHFFLINRVAVDSPTSAVLRTERPQASSSPGTPESSSKPSIEPSIPCRSDQPTRGQG